MGAYPHCRRKLLAAITTHDRYIDFSILQQVSDFARTVVGIYRHARDAESIEREFMQEMLWPVVEQHRRAMTVSIAVGAVNEAKPLDLARSCHEIDLVSVPMIVSVNAGWRSEERPRAVRFRRACESIAYCSRLIDRDHVGMPPTFELRRRRPSFCG